MTGTNCDLSTHKSSRSYLNHLVYELRMAQMGRIVTHGCETWRLAGRDVNRLLVVEGQVFGRLCGAVKTEEGCRIRSNEELDELMGGEDAVKYVRAQTIKWWGILTGWKKQKQ